MTKARTLADNYAADINQVTADAPLTGGGTSGTVTVGIQAGTTAQSGAVQLTDSTASTSTTTAATPNSVKSAYDLANTANTAASSAQTTANAAIAKSTIDAKGDLLVGSANDTVSRLAVASTAGYVLTVDSAEATGLKWAAASSPTFVGVNVSKSANQTLSNATFTTITFDVEQFDTDGFHSNTTNTSRLTVPSGKAGKYLIVVAVRFGQENSTGYRNATILKNGSEFYETGFPGTGSVENQWGFSAIADLAVGDYIELACSQNSGGNLNILGTLAQRRTNIGMYLIGA